ncbi:unnamed protein product [Protopolystoma xenopodis]|uniref:Secreted protein n=1 Tax=Protopolystoma xenopodis TaxID=117903 RepID=A0A448XNM6_9PLAT|nr:unnamed protein product [Protopolystoma xenopodis]
MTTHLKVHIFPGICPLVHLLFVPPTPGIRPGTAGRGTTTAWRYWRGAVGNCYFVRRRNDSLCRSDGNHVDLHF